MDGLTSVVCGIGATLMLLGGLAMVGFFGYIIYAVLAGLAAV